MRRITVFVDYENIQKVTITNVPDTIFQVLVFIGHSQSKILTSTITNLSTQSESIRWIQIEGQGKNNLDFHLCAELGVLHGSEPPETEFMIISNDKGFDCLTEYFTRRKNRKTVRVATMAEIERFLNLTPSAAGFHTADAKLEAFIDHLASVERKNWPRKESTFKNAIADFFKRQIGLAEVNQVFDGLVKRGIIRVAAAPPEPEQELAAPSHAPSRPGSTREIDEVSRSVLKLLAKIPRERRPLKESRLKNTVHSFLKGMEIQTDPVLIMTQLQKRGFYRRVGSSEVEYLDR